MISETRQADRSVPKLCYERYPDPEVRIHAELERFIQQTDLLQDIPPDKGAGLGDGRDPGRQPPFQVNRLLPAGLAPGECTSLGVNKRTPPIHGCGMRVPMQVGSRDVHRARLITIIRIQPRQDVPRGPSPALVDGIRLPVVRLRYPVNQPGFIPANHLHAAVGAAAVDDDVLQVGVSLQQYRPDGLLDELSLVVRGGNDAHPRAGGCLS